MKQKWIWIGAAAIPLCWLTISVAQSRRAGAQVPRTNQPYPTLGGPTIYNLSNRPLAYFSGGQFGYGFLNPYPMGSFGQPTQNPPTYVLVPYDPSQFNPGGFATLPPYAMPGRADSAGYATGIYPIARTNDTFEAEREKDGKLRIRWVGETTAARSVTFSLLDRRRTVLKEVAIERLPAEVRLDRNEKAAFALAVVVYVNGTTNVASFPVQMQAEPNERGASPPKNNGPVNGKAGNGKAQNGKTGPGE